MLKKTDCYFRIHLADHFRNEHQLVILDPDDIVGFGNVNYSICKFLVHGLVGFPVFLVVMGITGKVVE